MINIDLSSMNALEKKIHESMVLQSKTTPHIRINQAAKLCQCSVSKISKFVKKLGFKNYKQYTDFLYGKALVPRTSSTELQRIGAFLENFDTAMVDELFELIKQHEKVVLFGYGPSLLCAQYFEYRFRNSSEKMIIAVTDERAIVNVVDDKTLLLILTVTGRFHSFKNVYEDSKAKGAAVAIIVEEYNPELINQYDKIFWLSSDPQPDFLKPYEKSRTVFFIFLEEIIQRILGMQKQEEQKASSGKLSD